MHTDGLAGNRPAEKRLLKASRRTVNKVVNGSGPEAFNVDAAFLAILVNGPHAFNRLGDRNVKQVDNVVRCANPAKPPLASKVDDASVKLGEVLVVDCRHETRQLAAGVQKLPPTREDTCGCTKTRSRDTDGVAGWGDSVKAR